MRKNYKKLYLNLSKRIGAMHRFANKFGTGGFRSPIGSAFSRIDDELNDYLHRTLKDIAYGKNLERIK